MSFNLFGGGSRLRSQTFTTSGLFIPSDDLLEAGGFVEVLLVGGGGSGGSFAGGSAPFGVTGGGGGGQVIKKIVQVTGSTSVIIGAGGVAPTTDSSGNAGGNSQFGSLITALGGEGGRGDDNDVGNSGNTGGGALVSTLSTDASVYVGGCGAGAGGSPTLTVVGNETVRNGNWIRPVASIEGNHGGHAFCFNETFNSNSNNFFYYIAGKGLYGYGGGGGGGAYSNLSRPRSNSVFGVDGGGTCRYNGTAEDGKPNTGGGGSGALKSGSVTRNGGNGGSGICIVTWFE